jgi:hypothetical protein
MSRCRSFETQVTWNQRGLNGTNGQDGVCVKNTDQNVSVFSPSAT